MVETKPARAPLASFILWGPPGVGKTTLARVVLPGALVTLTITGTAEAIQIALNKLQK